METTLKVKDLLSQVKTMAEERGFKSVSDFSSIESNFSHTLEVEHIVTVDEENKLYKTSMLHSQFAQLMVGYNPEDEFCIEIEEQIEEFGVLKIVELLDFLLKHKVVYKVFAIPMKMDILGICTNNGVMINSGLGEAVVGPNFKMPSDWKCDNHFVKQRKLFLLYIIPTVEFFYPGGVRDFDLTRDKLNDLLSQEPQLNYGWNFVNEGEINSNQEIILF